MSIRLKNFGAILQNALELQEPMPEANWKALKNSPLKEELIEAYQSLGGVKDYPGLQCPHWQFVLPHGIIVQLDDELHFNAYRRTTLFTPFYHSITSLKPVNYRDFCRQFERDCKKTGTTPAEWSDPFSEKLFGKAEELGEFMENGSPKWKKRALEDLLQDAYATDQGIPIIRIAVWEKLMLNKKLYTLYELLLAPTDAQKVAIANFVIRKAEQLIGKDMPIKESFAEWREVLKASAAASNQFPLKR